jgi:hypothetical protein
MHPEVIAAFTMIIPSLVSLYWILNDENLFPTQTKIAGFGCMIHFPFSFMLHIYRAYGKDPQMRTLLYKFDVSFIHAHAFLQSFAWDLKCSVFQINYHLLSVAYIWHVDPLNYPTTKRNIDINTAIGVFCSLFPMKNRNFYCYIFTLLIFSVAFMVHSQKLCKEYSSTIFHILLGVPQYLLMRTTNLK